MTDGPKSPEQPTPSRAEGVTTSNPSATESQLQTSDITSLKELANPAKITGGRKINTSKGIPVALEQMPKPKIPKPRELSQSPTPQISTVDSDIQNPKGKFVDPRLRAAADANVRRIIPTPASGTEPSK